MYESQNITMRKMRPGPSEYVQRLYQLMYPAVNTFSRLKFKWTVLKRDILRRLMKFVLEFIRLTQQFELNSELYAVTAYVGRVMSQDKKNMQPERDSKSGPSKKKRSKALRTDLFGRLYIVSPKK
jgi:hypothetical protein